jgi:hypothetical protein
MAIARKRKQYRVIDVNGEKYGWRLNSLYDVDDQTHMIL